MQELTIQDLKDMVEGGAFLGSGGGGPVDVAIQMVEWISDQLNGQCVPMASHEEVPDDATMAVSAGGGSPEAASGRPLADVMADAFRKLDNDQTLHPDLTPEFSYVLPIEIGAGNCIVPFLVGVAVGLKKTGAPLPVVDTAGSGRAMPTVAQSSYAFPDYGLKLTPMVLAGDSVMTTCVTEDNDLADGIMRAVVEDVSYHDVAGIAMTPMTGANMKKSGIHHSMSRALEVGRVLRRARESGQQPLSVLPGPIEALLDHFNQDPNEPQAYLLADGKLTPLEVSSKDGFDIDTIGIEGSGGKFLIYTQNENLIAWQTDIASPLAISPDLICYVTADGHAFSNVEAVQTIKKEYVYVIGLRASQFARNDYFVKRYLTVLRGAHYGGAYVPIEKLQGQRKAMVARAGA